jgi:hypothetical protein
MKISQLRSAGFGLLVLACVVGCERTQSVPAEGVVTLAGKPLADATVMLTPARGSGPGPFIGKTDAAGHFSLGLRESPGGGAAVGDYSVIIATVMSDPSDVSTAKRPKEVVPERFRNGSEKFTIPEGGTTEAKFAM